MGLTATELGKIVGKSAKEINKRLNDAGLLEKVVDGFSITSKGKKFGEAISKTTRYGYEFVNYEWSSEVIKKIFSEAELGEIVAKQAKIAEIAKRMGRK